MKTKLLILASLCGFTVVVASAAEHVTPDNYRRAETDYMFKKKVDEGYFGKFGHVREPAAIDKQLVVRVNRDTLFSWGVFDLSESVTIVKPDTGTRFQSMLVINEDHYIKLTACDPGEYLLTREKIGTCYVQVAFRTLVDPGNPDDLKAANTIQDQIVVEQTSPGSFEIPDWDAASREQVGNGLKLMGRTLRDSKRMFGDVGDVDPVRHLIGTAGGFDGNPESDAIYFENEQKAYSLNNVTAKADADGTVNIQFGGDPKNASNYLPITPGWNYIVRLYRPRKEILDGTWKFPEAAISLK